MHYRKFKLAPLFTTFFQLHVTKILCPTGVSDFGPGNRNRCFDVLPDTLPAATTSEAYAIIFINALDVPPSHKQPNILYRLGLSRYGRKDKYCVPIIKYTQHYMGYLLLNEG